ncbi:CatA-like O-acetyltransferase [Roseivirga sp. BDSF3-8]|uniref:CatA-like O-acetyltransferase n=1 Tax=Roseivirga sp. BDSF3-8 TaxID=3241598 RepID=UPI003531F191
MKKIDLRNWYRKEHFEFFSLFEEPLYGLTVKVDCTQAYKQAKTRHLSFYLYYLHALLSSINEIEALKVRIIDGDPYLFDRIDVSATVDRPNGTFGYSYITYDADLERFSHLAKEEIKKVRESSSLFPDKSSEGVIHFSALPWLDFTSLSHARKFGSSDSIPKISVGKLTETGNKKTIPFSVHVHHALVDGIHLGQLVDLFQEKLDV